MRTSLLADQCLSCCLV